ncbi:unnamed protein product [Sphacelaria rigidula]
MVRCSGRPATQELSSREASSSITTALRPAGFCIRRVTYLSRVANFSIMWPRIEEVCWFPGAKATLRFKAARSRVMMEEVKVGYFSLP